MEVEHDGLVRREQAVEVPIRQPVRMLRLGLQAEEIHHIHEPDLQVGERRPQERRRGRASSVATSPAQAITTSGSAPESLLAHSQIPIPFAQCVIAASRSRYGR